MLPFLLNIVFPIAPWLKEYNSYETSCCTFSFVILLVYQQIKVFKLFKLYDAGERLNEEQERYEKEFGTLLPFLEFAIQVSNIVLNVIKNIAFLFLHF